MINASVAYVDQDRSGLSGRIIGAILPLEFDTPLEIPASGIARVMDSGAYVFVLSFPPRFEADVLARRQPSLQLDLDATAMVQAGNGSVFLQQIIAAEITKFVARSDKAITLPIDLVVTAQFNPNLQSTWFSSVMQVITNITILSVLLTGAAMIREREHGTIEHLLVMPVSPSEIMLAKIWANGLAIIVGATLSIWLVVQGILRGAHCRIDQPLYRWDGPLSGTGDGPCYLACDVYHLDVAIRPPGAAACGEHEPAVGQYDPHGEHPRLAAICDADRAIDAFRRLRAGHPLSQRGA